MRVRSLFHLYRIRLRSRLVQELLALVGIAVGVALLFASQVASTSLNRAVDQLTAAVVGEMRLQASARGQDGVPASLVTTIQQLPGVRAAAPVLQVPATVVGPRGERPINLLGTDPRFISLSSPQLRRFGSEALAQQRSVALPLPIAEAIGVTVGQPVRMAIAGRLVPAIVGLQLQEIDIGSLVDSPVAIAPLSYAQQLAGMEGRVSRVFVEPEPGQDREAAAAIRALGRDDIAVRPADFEAQIFHRASAPTNQSTTLFSAISALVGFLFAFNAMLLTMPRRRRLVVDLRFDGYSARAIVLVLAFDALMLGVVASAAGLVLGDLLSRTLFQPEPGYLAYAFLIGSERIVTWQSIAIAVVGGIVASGLGVLTPLRDILSRHPSRAVRFSPRPSRWPLVAGLVCLALTVAILAVGPAAALVGMLTLTAALLLMLPAAVGAGLGVLSWASRRSRSAVPTLALLEMRSPTIRARSLAIASTGAVAVFGSVAIQGAHDDLQRGLDGATRDVTANTWIAPPGPANMLSTTSFPDALRGQLAGVPGVESVRGVRGSFLDVDDRRVWVMAPPADADRPVPPGQLLERDELALATARVREGGWAVVSEAIAKDHGLSVGDSFALPSPRPSRFRVAALSTNVGWPPGAIILNADDYARAWGSDDVSAYDVSFARGVDPQEGASAIERALGPETGLAVETPTERANRQRAASRDGLSRLTQIATLVLIAAILAMAAATGGMIWQRRARLAGLKVDGFGDRAVWRVLLLESAVLLGVGCLTGALFGLLGQLLLSRALATVTGFPVLYAADFGMAAACFGLVTAVAVAIVAVPGYFAARVSPAVSFGE